jgi:hypothetical protein
MRFSGTLLGTCLLAATGLAAKLPTISNNVRGEYIEARTADVYTGPCYANGEVGQTGKLAVMGWHIEQGSFDGVKLDGLSVAGVLRAKDTLGDFTLTSNPSKAVIIVDRNASPEQQIALRGFAQRAGGALLSDVVRVDVQPIVFTMQDNSVHSRVASFVAGDLAKVSTRPLEETDQICHNESVWYPPLVKMEHAMAAYTTGNAYTGDALGETWSYPEKRGSFIGTFHYQD